MSDTSPDTPPAAVVRAPDFPPGLDWLFTGAANRSENARPNADAQRVGAQHGDAQRDDAQRASAGRALTLADLRGKVVIVDLWTYGCINCQHVLATLAALEARFPRELVVVGVHSGKFIAERDTARIAHAAHRLGAAGHPIVNDRQFRLWRAWAARGWPTLALIDPRGYVVWQQAGEPRLTALAERVAAVIAAADTAGTLDRTTRAWQTSAAVALGAQSAPNTRLRYPGGLAVSPPDAHGVRHMAVTSNGDGRPDARILIGRLTDDGRRLMVEQVVDGGADPLVRPQGLAFAADGSATLYVADTGTHRVRALDLATGAMRVIGGTGIRVRTAGDRAAGAMASPWGLLSFADGTLLVAMAGTHELWRLDPRGGASSTRVVAGGRGEGLIDVPPGTPARDALLAQPVGFATDGVRVWWADTEASAIRETTRTALDGTRDEGTRTLVGTGLFDFGDRDGIGDEVRLQHPGGLVWVPGVGRIFVSDGYNDAVKTLDPETREVVTVERGYAEPGALATDGERVFVVDTNAHRVRTVGGDDVEIV